MEPQPPFTDSIAGQDEPSPGDPLRKRQQVDSGPHDAFFAQPVCGLDSALGLRRAMGLQELYISMLRSFAESRCDTARQIRTALNLQDMKKAEYLSHSLLGISGQIGALRVPIDAQELEDAISAGSSGVAVEGLLLRLEASLAELIGSLEAALPARPASAD